MAAPAPPRALQAIRALFAVSLAASVLSLFLFPRGYAECLLLTIILGIAWAILHVRAERADAAIPRSLDEMVRTLSRRGYQIITRDATSAQLRRPKRFSLIASLLWFLCFGVGIIVYLLYYAAKRDTLIYLHVDADGIARRA